MTDPEPALVSFDARLVDTVIGYARRDGVTVTRAAAEQALWTFVFEHNTGRLPDSMGWLTMLAAEVWQDRHDILDPTPWTDGLEDADPMYPSLEWETVGTVTPTTPPGEAVAVPALPAALVLSDPVKSVRETLCIAQAAGTR